MSDPRETLARIRAQAGAATEGPWEVSMDRIERTGGGEYAVAYDVAREEDAEFIAAARTDVPWLLEQVEIRDKALEAVLELHGPGRTFHGHGFSTQLCTCGSKCPCPTVQAITDALGGGTDAPR